MMFSRYRMQMFLIETLERCFRYEVIVKNPFELFGLDGEREWWDNPYDEWLQENKIFLFMSEMSCSETWSYRFMFKKSAVYFKLTWG